MSFLIVLPSIYQPYTDACVDSMSPTLRSQLRIINNVPPNPNRGVAGSWNVVAKEVLADKYDWLIVCSAATRFGEPGGEDFIEHLDSLPDAWSVETGISKSGRLPVVGWHCIAWSHWLLKNVGLFDENFWPAYGEDMDWSYRVLVARTENPDTPEPFWPKVQIEAEIESAGHGVALGRAKIDWPAIHSYYNHKWNGSFGQEKYTRPFGNPDYGLDYWPTPTRRQT